MGFSLFSAIGGAAEKYSEIEDANRRAKLEDARDVSRMIRDNALTTFGEYQKTKKQNDALAKQLKGMGLDDAKVLGLINSGPEQALYFSQNANKVLGAINADRPEGQKLTANDLINLTNPEQTGVDYQEGLANLSGVYNPEGGFEFDEDSQYGKAITSLATALGQDPAELAAITSGNLSYGAAPSIGYSEEWQSMEGLGMRTDMAQLKKLRADAAAAEIKVDYLPTQMDLEVADKKLQLQQREFAVASQAGDRLLDRTEQLARIRAANNADEKHQAEMATLDDLLAAELEKAKADAAKAGAPDKKTPPDAQVEAKRAQDAFNEMLNLRMQTTEVDGKPLLAIDPDTGTMSFAGSEDAIAKRNEIMITSAQQYLKGSLANGNFTPAQLAHKVTAVTNGLTDAQIVGAFPEMNPKDNKKHFETMIANPYQPYGGIVGGKFVLQYFDPATKSIKIVGR